MRGKPDALHSRSSSVPTRETFYSKRHSFAIPMLAARKIGSKGSSTCFARSRSFFDALTGINAPH